MSRSGGWSAAVLAAAALLSIALAAEAPTASNPFRVRVEAARHTQVRFSGSYTAAGRTIEVRAATTPWEYVSETGASVSGTFRADDPEKPIRVDIIEGSSSDGKPAAEAKGAAVEFAWGPEGRSPRFVAMPRHGAAKRAPEK